MVVVVVVMPDGMVQTTLNSGSRVRTSGNTGFPKILCRQDPLVFHVPCPVTPVNGFVSEGLKLQEMELRCLAD